MKSTDKSSDLISDYKPANFTFTFNIVYSENHEEPSTLIVFKSMHKL